MPIVAKKESCMLAVNKYCGLYARIISAARQIEFYIKLSLSKTKDNNIQLAIIVALIAGGFEPVRIA